MNRRLISLGLVALPALAIAVVAPEIITGTFSDAETFLRAAGFTVAIGGWVFAMRRWVRPPRLAGLLAVIVVTTTSTTTTTTPPPSTTASPTTTTTTTVPAGPVELRRAQFQGLTGHRGPGDAVVYRQADGSHLLRFEEADIGSGPDLEVYLVPGDDQRGLSDATHVAPLTAERGNQNYTIPGGVDLTDGTWTVLVWCETFAVEVANATLA